MEIYENMIICNTSSKSYRARKGTQLVLYLGAGFEENELSRLNLNDSLAFHEFYHNTFSWESSAIHQFLSSSSSAPTSGSGTATSIFWSNCFTSRFRNIKLSPSPKHVKWIWPSSPLPSVHNTQFEGLTSFGSCRKTSCVTIPISRDVRRAKHEALSRLMLAIKTMHRLQLRVHQFFGSRSVRYDELNINQTTTILRQALDDKNKDYHSSRLHHASFRARIGAFETVILTEKAGPSMLGITPVPAEHPHVSWHAAAQARSFINDTLSKYSLE
ncbi:hypothetical protein SELMODRAFT_409848 [Selaginella moellendorffii]|uniref:Uncharacterized protein n=1 Tax=Selaginella moellendorffii TaxID=88036 RepID=D8RCN1_SELML|nr:hypothetical protein SELMODRAFT_409848 [Selaginella moellendorffii]